MNHIKFIKKIINYSKIKISKFTFLMSFLFKKIIIQILQNYNSFDDTYLYIYIGKAYGSILHKLSEELAKELKNYFKIEFVNTINCIQEKFFFKNSFVICIHQSQISELVEAGIKPSHLITIYTHTNLQTIKKFISYSQKIKAILSISQHEKARLIANNLTNNNIYYFPIGFDPKQFKYHKKNDLENRKFDVIFSLSYIKKFNSKNKIINYHLRKRYNLVVSIANALTTSGYSVCILGQNWFECEYELEKNIHIICDKYPNYRKHYLNSRLFCMPSYLEGSPTGLAEALSSNCFLLLSPTGWALDLQPSSKYKVQLMPFESKTEEWVKKIQLILSNKNENDLENIYHVNRKKFLKKLEFKSLALKLKNIII